MATKKQIEANRENAALERLRERPEARQSTGPKSDAGKAKSAQNGVAAAPRKRSDGVKHGLTTRRVLLPDEDQTAYREYLIGTMGELEPLGNMETLLARRACDLMWRLDRCGSIEAQLLVRGHQQREALGLSSAADELGEAASEINWGAAFAGQDALTELYRYESALQRNLDRTLHQLRELQERRWAEERVFMEQVQERHRKESQQRRYDGMADGAAQGEARGKLLNSGVEGREFFGGSPLGDPEHAAPVSPAGDRSSADRNRGGHDGHDRHDGGAVRRILNAPR